MSQDRENVLDAAEALGALPDAPSDAPFAPGEAVGHEVYGNGTVRECVMAGQQWSVRVNFGTDERSIVGTFLQSLEEAAESAPADDTDEGAIAPAVPEEPEEPIEEIAEVTEMEPVAVEAGVEPVEAVEVEAVPVVEEPAEPEDEGSLEASQARATMQVVAQRLGLEGDEPWKVEDGESLEISQARATMQVVAQRLGLEGDVQPVEDGMFNTDTKLLGAAPEEWRELEEIDKDAELEDYCENGIWDIDGLRDDLKLAEASRTAIARGLMKEKLGKQVKPSGKNDEQESEVGIILSPGDNDSSKKSDYSSVKSKLEVLRELKALLDEKIIDDKEFKKMKKEIIN